MLGIFANALFSGEDPARFRTVFCFGSMSETTSLGTLGAGGGSGAAAFPFSAGVAGFAEVLGAPVGLALLASPGFFALVFGFVLVGIKNS
jgi:hypothetical protein